MLHIVDTDSCKMEAQDENDVAENLGYGLEATEDSPVEEGNTGVEGKGRLAADIGLEGEPTAVVDGPHREEGYFVMVDLVPTHQWPWRLS